MSKGASSPTRGFLVVEVQSTPQSKLRFSIATEGNAVDFGDLTARQLVHWHVNFNDHGGL